MLEWGTCPREARPRRTGKKRCYGHKSGGQYVAVLFGLQLPITHNPFNKVRGRFFLRGCPRSVMVKAMDCGIIASSYSSRAIMFTFGQIPLGKV